MGRFINKRSRQYKDQGHQIKLVITEARFHCLYECFNCLDCHRLKYRLLVGNFFYSISHFPLPYF